ncbi:MAG: hypothetical protein AB8G77_02435 [Rhodothermales bacterium]
MNNQSSMLLQVFVVLLVVLTSGCEKTDPASSYPEPFYGQLLVGDTLLSPVPQQKTTREFEPMATVEIHQFTVAPALATEDTPAELVMEKPHRVTVSRAGDVLYVLDTESLLINKYNLLDGSLLNVITTANENRTSNNHFARLWLISDAEIGVAGVEAARIMRINEEGESLGFIDYNSGGGFVAASGKQIWLESLNEYELFHVYNENGEKERAFGILSSVRYEFKEHKLNGHGMGFAGTMATDGADSFIYTNGYGSGLLGYRTDGSVVFFRELIDNTPFPEMVVSGDQGSVDDKDVVASRLSLNVWENVYYQYVFWYEAGKESVIDAYDYNTGDYLYSIKSPADCGVLYISNTHIYANCLDRGVIQFERPSLGSQNSKAKS